MAQLQNQLNQVLIMMQQSQSNSPAPNISSGKLSSSFISGMHHTRHALIASFQSNSQGIWIIDSGATDHICTSLSTMHNTRTCPTPIQVHLPNGTCFNVNTIGTVKLQSTLILHNVLYIPSFAYNLISVNLHTPHTNQSHLLRLIVNFRAMMIQSLKVLFVVDSTLYLSSPLIHLQLLFSILATPTYGMPDWDTLHFKSFRK